jgi:Ca-activated chloride channel family protein
VTLDRITPRNYKTQTYRPKHQLFMYPLGLGIVLVLVYHLTMFGWTSLIPLFGRQRNVASDALPTPQP